MRKIIVILSFLFFLTFAAFATDYMKISLKNKDNIVVFYDGKIRNSLIENMKECKPIRFPLNLEKKICVEGTYIIEIEEKSNKKIYEIDNEFFYYCSSNNTFYRGNILSIVRDYLFSYMMKSENNMKVINDFFFAK